MERIRTRLRQFLDTLADDEADFFTTRSDCVRVVAEQAKLLHATAVSKERLRNHPFLDFLWDNDEQLNRVLDDEGQRLAQLMEVEQLSDGTESV
jgi:hypothetical protein